jgi:hypothetical protein
MEMLEPLWRCYHASCRVNPQPCISYVAMRVSCITDCVELHVTDYVVCNRPHGVPFMYVCLICMLYVCGDGRDVSGPYI